MIYGKVSFLDLDLFDAGHGMRLHSYCGISLR